MSILPGTVTSVTITTVTMSTPATIDHVEPRAGRTRAKTAALSPPNKPGPIRRLIATFKFSITANVPASSSAQRGTKRKLEASEDDKVINTGANGRVDQSFDIALMLDKLINLTDVQPKALKKKRAAKPVQALPAKEQVKKVRKSSPKKADKVTKPDNRPLPWGEPQVWADNRSDLSGALPYFQAYEGSTYTGNGVVKGMLIDNDNGERQYMDDQIAIVRAGGGIGNNGSGNRTQMKDQDPNRHGVANFRHNMERMIPFILIVGSQNMHTPAKIPHRYCVLGVFQVTDIWPEKTNSCVVWRFRLEKIDLHRKSWWAAEGSVHSQGSTQIKARKQKCDKCGQVSKQVYSNGWMCMNEKCALHWKLNKEDPPENLEVDYRFKNERTTFNGSLPPFPIVPKLPEATGFQTVSRQCWKGIVCPKCGRCNPRIDWDAWRCQNLTCDFELAPPREIIPPSAVMGDLSHEYQGHAISEDSFDRDQVNCDVKTHGFYKINDYKLGPDINVSHGLANGIINSQPGAADEVFRGLQEGNLDLKRLSILSPTGGSRAAHFSKNYGLPYQYILKHEDSTSLEEAPKEVQETMRRMKWAATRNGGDDGAVVFNECLAVGYLEGGKMGYHDDGESTLGPKIAAWSLGCPAWMTFRMKFKYYTGFNQDRTKYDPNLPIIPGCFKPEARRELNAMASKMSREDLCKTAKQKLEGFPSFAPVIIKMLLRHGDFVCMDGADMQLYYEHAVKPTHELRFGLTCRYIKPEMIPEDMHSKGDLYLDPAMAYDGDLQTYKNWKDANDAAADNASMRRRDAASSSATEA